MCITKITHQACGHFYTSYVKNSTACAYETHEDPASKNAVHGWNAQICWDCGQRLFNVARMPEITEWLENIKEGAPPGGDGRAEKSAEGGKKGRKGIFVALPRLALLGRKNKAPDQEGKRPDRRGGGIFGRSSA